MKLQWSGDIKDRISSFLLRKIVKIVKKEIKKIEKNVYNATVPLNRFGEPPFSCPLYFYVFCTVLLSFLSFYILSSVKILTKKCTHFLFY